MPMPAMAVRHSTEEWDGIGRLAVAKESLVWAKEESHAGYDEKVVWSRYEYGLSDVSEVCTATGTAHSIDSLLIAACRPVRVSHRPSAPPQA